MIFFDFNGGLGNQLFNLATIYSFSNNGFNSLVARPRGCDSSESFDGSWHVADLIEQISPRIGIIRTDTQLKKYKEKIFDKLRASESYDQNQTIQLFTKFKNPMNNVEIQQFQSRFFAEYAVTNGFRDLMQAFRKERSDQGFLIHPSSQHSVCLHLRRATLTAPNGHGEVGSDDWFISSLAELPVSPTEIVCFTNSKEQASSLRNYYPDIKIFGQEMGPLDSLLSMSNFRYQILSKSTFSFWANAISASEYTIGPFEATDKLRPLFNFKFSPYF